MASISLRTFYSKCELPSIFCWCGSAIILGGGMPIKPGGGFDTSKLGGGFVKSTCGGKTVGGA